MANSDYDQEIIGDKRITKLPLKAPRRRWLMATLLLTMVLAFFLAVILSTAGAGHISMDINGEPVNGLQAVSLGVVGVLMTVIAIVLALVLVVAVVAGASLLAVLIIALIIGSIMVALTPAWLPMVLLIMLGLWVVRRR